MERPQFVKAALETSDVLVRYRARKWESFDVGDFDHIVLVFDHMKKRLVRCRLVLSDGATKSFELGKNRGNIYLNYTLGNNCGNSLKTKLFIYKV